MVARKVVWSVEMTVIWKVSEMVDAKADYQAAVLVARLVAHLAKMQVAKKDSDPAGLLAAKPVVVTVACGAVRWVVSKADQTVAMTAVMMAEQSG